MIEKQYVCRADDECIWRVVDNETIIVTKDGKNLHRLNEVSSEIWKVAAGNLTVDEVISHICSEFEVNEGVAKRDVIEFIDKLSHMKLLMLLEKQKE